MAIDYRRITARTDDVGATEHRVRMRDGVHLATDVYLPDGDTGPGPAILTRLPYDKRGEYTFMYDIAAHFIARGYRMVVQDVRGKFRSEGETLLCVNEAADGHDTIDWIIAQPWSDGIVGMWGDSYYGYTQLAALSTNHPALRAIAPRVTGTRLGQLPIPTAGEWVGEAEMSVCRVYPLTHFQSRDTFEWEMRWERPYAAVVEEWCETVGERSPSYDLWMPRPVALRRFPDGHPFDGPPVPILQTIGWFDNCAPWQWADVAEIERRPGWARLQHLQLEAIDHENHDFAELPLPAEDDPAYVALRRGMLGRYLDPAVAFFDVYLRGLAAADTIPRVRWTPAGGETRTATSWPPPGSHVVTLHPAPDGTLADRSAAATGEASWVHDPDDPVVSPVVNPFAFLAEYPDERGLAERADVLAFDTAPVTEPWLLAGPVTLTVAVRSDGPEFDVFARVADVAPDGATHLIARGQVTVRRPDPPDPIEIDLGHTGYVLAPGHRLRLTIAGADAPEFVPAPGTGEHRWLAVDVRPTTQSVVLGGPAGASLRITVGPDG